MRIVASVPLVFRYRGTLHDTAVLVGLRNIRAFPERIIYCGEKSFELRRYVLTLNRWLAEQRLPLVSMSSEPLTARWRVSTKDNLSAWGWDDEACVAAIRLAGLPLPPESEPRICV